MVYLVGLGNPGPDYAHTRHNIGWLVLDALTDEAFAMDKKINAAVATTTLADTQVTLIKPQTYMNRSGETVRGLIDYYHVPESSIWLIHDEIDLPFGTLRISEGRSAAGHRGVGSVYTSIGSETLTRFRIGIRPDHPFDTERYVMERFSTEQLRTLPEIITHVRTALTRAIETSPAQAASEVN